MPSNANAAVRHLFRTFRYRNYRLFFLGQSVAITGGWMTFAALGWLLYRLTGNPLTLGLMGFFLHAPTFFLSPFGGVLVDHVSRRKVIICAQAVDALTVSVLAVLTLSGQITVWQVMTACTLLGITKAFEMPARQALVADIVEERDDLPNAIALNSTIFHGARLIGPMLAGMVLIPLGGEGACFVAHVICYLFAMYCFGRLRPKPMERDPRGFSILRELGEGFGYAFGYPPVRDLMLLMAGLACLGMPYNTLLPIFAETILGGDAGTYGLLLAVTGMGAVVAAIFLASRPSVLGLGRIIAGSSVLFGVTLFFFAQSATLWWSLVLLFVTGMVSINAMVGTNTIIQTLVEDRLRGRVMSLMGMVFMGAMPLGALLFGKGAASIGTPTTVSLAAAGCVLIGLAFSARLPSLRRKARSVYQERGVIPMD